MLAPQADGAARSPAVVGAVLAYVRELFGLLGVDLLDRQVTTHLERQTHTRLLIPVRSLEVN